MNNRKTNIKVFLSIGAVFCILVFLMSKSYESVRAGLILSAFYLVLVLAIMWLWKEFLAQCKQRKWSFLNFLLLLVAIITIIGAAAMQINVSVAIHNMKQHPPTAPNQKARPGEEIR